MESMEKIISDINSKNTNGPVVRVDGENIIFKKDVVVGWFDGALLLKDGSVFEHTFKKKPLADILRKRFFITGIRSLLTGSTVISSNAILPDDGSKKLGLIAMVRSRDLSLAVTGRMRRIVPEIVIYWHSASDFIYTLTGITYCASICIQCGYEGANGDFVLLKTPKLFLVRAHDGYNSDPERITGKWPQDVHIFLWHHSPNSEGSLLGNAEDIEEGTVGFPRGIIQSDGMSQRESLSVRIDSSVIRESMFGYNMEDRLSLDWDTTIFLQRAEGVHKRIKNMEGELECVGRRKDLAEQCVSLAGQKRMLLLEGDPMTNLFASHVCLYGMGEKNIAEEMIGVFFRRWDRSSSEYNLHNVALSRAVQLAIILRSLADHVSDLPEVSERLDFSESSVLIARDFYAGYADMGNMKVLAAAAGVCRRFSVRCSIEDAIGGLKTPLLAAVERVDVVRLLNL